MIKQIDNELEGIGVWLKRPFIFSVSEASFTFFNYADFEDDKHPHLSALISLNDCIENEAEKISNKRWDNG